MTEFSPLLQAVRFIKRKKECATECRILNYCHSRLPGSEYASISPSHLHIKLSAAVESGALVRTFHERSRAYVYHISRDSSKAQNSPSVPTSSSLISTSITITPSSQSLTHTSRSSSSRTVSTDTTNHTTKSVVSALTVAATALNSDHLGDCILNVLQGDYSKPISFDTLEKRIVDSGIIGNVEDEAENNSENQRQRFTILLMEALHRLVTSGHVIKIEHSSSATLKKGGIAGLPLYRLPYSTKGSLTFPALSRTSSEARSLLRRKLLDRGEVAPLVRQLQKPSVKKKQQQQEISPRNCKPKTQQASKCNSTSRETIVRPVCRFCSKGSEVSPKSARTSLEELVTCCVCSRLAHPSCLSWSAEVSKHMRESSSWRCVECSSCVNCHKPGSRDIRLCGHCNAVYHITCSNRLAKDSSQQYCNACQTSQTSHSDESGVSPPTLGSPFTVMPKLKPAIQRSHRKSRKFSRSTRRLGETPFPPVLSSPHEIVAALTPQQMRSVTTDHHNSHSVTGSPSVFNKYSHHSHTRSNNTTSSHPLPFKKRRFVSPRSRELSALSDHLSRYFTPSNARQSRASTSSLVQCEDELLSPLAPPPPPVPPPPTHISLGKTRASTHAGKEGSSATQSPDTKPQRRAVSTKRPASSSSRKLNTIPKKRAKQTRNVNAEIGEQLHGGMVQVKQEEFSTTSMEEKSPMGDIQEEAKIASPLEACSSEKDLEVGSFPSMDPPPDSENPVPETTTVTPAENGTASPPEDNVVVICNKSDDIVEESPEVTSPPVPSVTWHSCRLHVGSWQSVKKYCVEAQCTTPPIPALLFVCPVCLDWLDTKTMLTSHEKTCVVHPPGPCIYHDGSIRVYRVDALEHTTYYSHLNILATLLSGNLLLPPLYLGGKSVEENSSDILLVTEGDRVAAYFTHTPHHAVTRPLAILPTFHTMKYLRFLIQFCCTISRVESDQVSPPDLSILSAAPVQIAFHSFCCSKLVCFLMERSATITSLDGDMELLAVDASKQTGIDKVHVLTLLQELQRGMLVSGESLHECVTTLHKRCATATWLSIHEEDIEWTSRHSEDNNRNDTDMWKCDFGDGWDFTVHKQRRCHSVVDRRCGVSKRRQRSLSMSTATVCYPPSSLDSMIDTMPVTPLEAAPLQSDSLDETMPCIVVTQLLSPVSVTIGTEMSTSHLLDKSITLPQLELGDINCYSLEHLAPDTLTEHHSNTPDTLCMMEDSELDTPELVAEGDGDGGHYTEMEDVEENEVGVNNEVNENHEVTMEESPPLDNPMLTEESTSSHHTPLQLSVAQESPSPIIFAETEMKNGSPTVSAFCTSSPTVEQQPLPSVPDVQSGVEEEQQEPPPVSRSSLPSSLSPVEEEEEEVNESTFFDLADEPPPAPAPVSPSSSSEHSVESDHADFDTQPGAPRRFEEFEEEVDLNHTESANHLPDGELVEDSLILHPLDSEDLAMLNYSEVMASAAASTGPMAAPSQQASPAVCLGGGVAPPGQSHCLLSPNSYQAQPSVNSMVEVPSPRQVCSASAALAITSPMSNCGGSAANPGSVHSGVHASSPLACLSVPTLLPPEPHPLEPSPAANLPYPVAPEGQPSLSYPTTPIQPPPVTPQPSVGPLHDLQRIRQSGNSAPSFQASLAEPLAATVPSVTGPRGFPKVDSCNTTKPVTSSFPGTDYLQAMPQQQWVTTKPHSVGAFPVAPPASSQPGLGCYPPGYQDFMYNPFYQAYHHAIAASTSHFPSPHSPFSSPPSSATSTSTSTTRFPFPAAAAAAVGNSSVPLAAYPYPSGAPPSSPAYYQSAQRYPPPVGPESFFSQHANSALLAQHHAFMMAMRGGQSHPLQSPPQMLPQHPNNQGIPLVPSVHSVTSGHPRAPAVVAPHPHPTTAAPVHPSVPLNKIMPSAAHFMKH